MRAVPKINLYPWRENVRQERKKEFVVWAWLMGGLAFIVIFVVWVILNGLVLAQKSTNDYLSNEIAILDKQIEEIKRLREQTDALLSRKKVIEDLQSNRNGVVKLFNVLPQVVPEGVYLVSIKQTGDLIDFVGIAESNSRVSAMMRNIELSEGLEKPGLKESKAEIIDRRRLFRFMMSASIVRDGPNAAVGQDLDQTSSLLDSVSTKG